MGCNNIFGGCRHRHDNNFRDNDDFGRRSSRNCMGMRHNCESELSPRRHNRCNFLCFSRHSDR